MCVCVCVVLRPTVRFSEAHQNVFDQRASCFHVFRLNLNLPSIDGSVCVSAASSLPETKSLNKAFLSHRYSGYNVRPYPEVLWEM